MRARHKTCGRAAREPRCRSLVRGAHLTHKSMQHCDTTATPTHGHFMLDNLSRPQQDEPPHLAAGRLTHNGCRSTGDQSADWLARANSPTARATMGRHERREACRHLVGARIYLHSITKLLSLALLVVCLLLNAVDQMQATNSDHQVKHNARELVRRAASIAGAASTAATSPDDRHLRSNNEISALSMATSNQHLQMAPSLPPKFVKLGNNTSSHVRYLHHTTSSTGQQQLKAPAYNNQSISDIAISHASSRRLPEKVCIGTTNRISMQLNKTEHYQNLVERYKNCTHIIGNLEITGLGSEDRQIDLSFLESIREITGYLLIAYVQLERIRLPNLLIIRGREVFTVQNGKHEESSHFAMFLINNGLRFLELPNLREIIYGNVGFYHNSNLCSVNKLDWSEILNKGFGARYAYDAEVPRPTCPECHSSCLHGCWGPGEGLCQQFSKSGCPEQCDQGRCYGHGPRDCCHMMCAGGCTGPKQTDCFACKNFNNDGECVPECPPMQKYNPSKFLWEPDRNGKHAYGASCVKDCPEHLLRDNGACVRSCPDDKKSQDGECVPCAGPCPKNCRGVDVVNSDNIDYFINCTEIEGSITILDSSFNGYAEMLPNNSIGVRHEPMHPRRLNVLKTVRSITGHLNIQAAHPDFKDLSCFSRLEVILGRQTTDMNLALSIIKTSLVSLNLRSLKQIKNGRVLIEENKNLCYANASQFSKNGITHESLTIRNNGDDRECARVGLKCNSQCAPGGCWGPGQDECLACNHYKLDDYCVHNCTSTRSLEILSYDAGDRTCGRCHHECKSGCSGTSAKSCWQCKNFKDGPYCVRECPKHKYNDNGVCQECSKLCVDGCTGPSDRLGPGGCNACDKFVVESTKNSSIVANCLKQDEPCPRGFYQEYGAEVESRHPMKAMERKPVCKRCHSKCKSCTGYGTHKDVCECAGYMANDQCEETCPRDFYPDEKSRRCLRCSRECNGCFGPTEANCLNCRVYRIYYESSVAIASARVSDPTPASIKLNRQENRFNCTSQCPPEKPHRVSEGNLIDPYCSEDPGPDADNPRIVSIGSTSFLFILVTSGSIMFCISVYRCQVEKDKTAKLAMALSLGITDNEPTKQSNIEPNRGNFNPITTSELRQGAMLGHGVGGTVYKAYWCPKDEPKKKIPVAMKILHDNGQQNMHKEFLEEAYIMASVNHDNLVSLLGVCATPKELIIVTPLMPLGCLRDYVEKNKHTIGPKHLLEWGKQIANGMAYLEEHRMVHRDLALRNVLLQNASRALISDFGLAKFLELDQSEYHSGGGRLPIKWLAPECIQERKFTHKSDVWAFGVTIWELLTFGEKPFEELEPKDVPQAIMNGARLVQPHYVTAEVYKVMYACWFYNPEERPNFESLRQDFISFARDPERYLDWRPNDLLQNPGGRGSSNDDEDDYDFDEETSLNGRNSPRLNNMDMANHHNKINEMMGIEMRQHNSESDGQKTSPTVSKMGVFSNVSSQPLIAEDVFSRSSQQTSAKSSNTTITDPNNNLIMSGGASGSGINNNNQSNNNNNNNNNNNGHNFPSRASTMRMTADSWWSVAGHTVSNNSLGHRSEQPTDSDDYLMPSPCSKEEKFTRFYDQQLQNDPRLPPRPRPPSSRDPPHSAGLIGVSNDAYFITRGMRNYANTTGATNASSGHIPSSLV